MLNSKLFQILITKSLARKYSSSNSLTKVEFQNGIKKITMCDQKTRNSLSIAMMQDLLQHINSDANNQKLRIIILTATGPVFSAGHNLKELAPQLGRERQEKVFKICTDLMYSIIDCPVPVIAQINGLAAAAGCQLVAQCDIAICTDGSHFSTPGANFGIFCSTPGIPLARKALKSTSLNMLLTGEPISAMQAKFSGLITKVCAPDQLDDEVEKTCQLIMSKSRSVIQLGKKFYYEQVDLKLREAYQFGAKKMVDNLNMVDGKEGVTSFAEKRKPVWTHENN